MIAGSDDTVPARGLRVLLLAKYDRKHPSSRVRFHTYLPYLAQLGVEVTVANLLPESYTVDLFEGRTTNLGKVALAYLRRATMLVRARQHDVIWLEGELWPRSPAWGEALLDAVRRPYVADYDDAIFHRYDLSRNPLIRTLLKGKIDVVMRHAAAVVVANQYVRQRALAAGAKQVHVIPSVVDLERYTLPIGPKQHSMAVGWVGSPISAPFLESIAPALNRVKHATGAHILIIGAGQHLKHSFEAEVRDWSEESEVSDIGNFAVGIMPLVDSPIARGKSGYKLIQYMACRVPVVASPIGENAHIIEHGVDGLLATSDEDWYSALVTLLTRKDLREQIGGAGRAKVERLYSVQATVSRMASVLIEAAG